MAGETILVVDERVENITFVQQQVLEPNGYRALSSNDGAEALKMTLSQSIDLIISDLDAPTLGGLALLESLHEADRMLPVIVTTLYSSEETAVKAFRLGAKDYIIKPYMAAEMMAAIERALLETRLRQERDILTKNLRKANRQTENHRKELHALYAIGRSVSALLDLEPLLNRIVEAAIYVSSAEEGAIMLVDDRGDLTLRATRGMGDTVARGFKVKVHDSIAGRVVKTGKPVIIGGQDENDSFKLSTSHFVKSMLNVPIKCGNRIIGVLAVSTKEKSGPFEGRHLGLLSNLADYAGIAIENARLYSQVMQQTSPAKAQKENQDQIDQASANHSGRLTQGDMHIALKYLAAGVAHEITPAIEGMVQGLHNITEIAANQPKISLEKISLEIENIAREGSKCRQTLEHLLEYANQEPAEKEALDLNVALEAAWQQLETKASFSDAVKVIRKDQPNLGPVLADEKQMTQALFYLLQNAFESMPKGGTLHIITRAVGDETQVIISDTGEGLAANQVPHIFDPFYRGSPGSYGLGLAIAYNIIEGHHGTIEVDTKAGKGTTFTLHLPISGH